MEKKLFELKFIINYNTFFGQELCISGNIPELGNWTSPKKMKWTENNFWEFSIELSQLPQKFEYKYLINYENGTNYENRPNRIVFLSLLSDWKKIKINDVWENVIIYELEYEQMSFLFYLPEKKLLNFEKKSITPLILFLHGASEKFVSLKSLIYKEYDCGPLTQALKNPNFNFAVLVPQCFATFSWTNTLMMEKLEKLIVDIIKNYNFDTKSTFLTGFSMGGGGAFQLYCNRTDIFAACAVLCGFKPSYNKNCYNLKNKPLMIVHGIEDKIIKVDASLEIYDLMKSMKNEPKLILLENFEHIIWKEIYSKDYFYQWFLENIK